MAREPSRGRGVRLDQPKERSRGLSRPSMDPEQVGRVSERIARFLGSWRFIGYMTAFIVAWIAWNLLAPERWQFDPWGRGLVLLTLLLSLQASYAAPLILLAQNRQSDRDRVQYQDDRGRTDRLIADTEYLTREIASLRLALSEVATRDFVRSELRDLLEDVADAVGVEAADARPPERRTPERRAEPRGPEPRRQPPAAGRPRG